MFSGFKATSLKAQLKMAVSRIQIASNKKAALLKQSMREVAIMLAEDPPKEEKAKIRAEALIRDDHLIEAYSILQLECELLHERIKLIEFCKDCPPDLVPVVSTLIWASHRVDIPELAMIRKQFRAKYGKKFEEAALINSGGILNERVVHKLSVEPPAAYLVQTYLERICEQFEVDWKPKYKLSAEQMCEPTAAPIGYSVPVAHGTGLGPVEAYVEIPGSNNHLHPSGGSGSGGKMDPLPPPLVPPGNVQPYSIPPPAPGSAAAHANNKKNNMVVHDDFAEPDIYVPPPRSQPSSSMNQNISPLTSKDGEHTANDADDDDDDSGNNPATPGGGGAGSGVVRGGSGRPQPTVSASYANLAARFEQLKK